MPNGIARRDVQRILRDIRCDDARPRIPRGYGYRDASASSADIPYRGIPGMRLLQRKLHQEFRLGPRYQHGRRNGKFEPVKLLRSANIGQRNSPGPLQNRIAKLADLSGIQAPFRIRHHIQASCPQCPRQKKLRLRTRQIDAGISELRVPFSCQVAYAK